MNIAIAGKMGSGKSTMADYLVQFYGYKEWKLSTAIKVTCDEFFGEGNYGRSEMQALANFLREHNPLALVNHLENSMNEQVTDPRCLESYNVVSDVRTVAEAEYLRSKGYLIVKVEAHSEVREKRVMMRDNVDDSCVRKWSSDSSESEVDSIEADHTLKNDGFFRFLDKVDLLLEGRADRRDSPWMVLEG